MKTVMCMAYMKYKVSAAYIDTYLKPLESISICKQFCFCFSLFWTDAL